MSAANPKCFRFCCRQCRRHPGTPDRTQPHRHGGYVLLDVQVLLRNGQLPDEKKGSEDQSRKLVYFSSTPNTCTIKSFLNLRTRLPFPSVPPIMHHNILLVWAPFVRPTQTELFQATICQTDWRKSPPLFLPPHPFPPDGGGGGGGGNEGSAKGLKTAEQRVLPFLSN